MNPTSSETAPIPAHVAPHLVVHSFPLIVGTTTSENPFQTIIPKIHEGPEVMYCPTGYLGFAPAWIFRTAKDLQAIYMDNEHFTSKGYSPFAKLCGESWSIVPTELDPPVHGLFRNMVNPLFTPRRMAALDARVRDFAREYINKFKARGECEFMNEFAFRFPINVFLELMGLSMDKVDTFLEWENGMLHSGDMAQIAESTRSVKKFLLEEIEARRANPGDDLISFGITAEVDGRKMTEEELFGFCFNLFIGGMDTVSTNIAWQIRHLAEHPEQQAQLRANPELIPTAVEEMLRNYAAVTTARTCTKPVQINGAQLMPGEKVLMSTTLANSDPAAFENPAEVHLDRNPRHLTFGSGIHRCVGAPLARRELIIAIEEFLKMLPEFRIAPGAKLETHLGNVIQPILLPLVWKN